MLNIYRVRVAIVSILALSACQASGAAIGQGQVEVYIIGSDIATPENIATRRLRDAIEDAALERPDVGLSTTESPGSLIIYIPDFVEIDRSTHPARITYRALIRRRASTLPQEISDSCYETQISDCAQTILEATLALPH
jgi:hypothetical protein